MWVTREQFWWPQAETAGVCLAELEPSPSTASQNLKLIATLGKYGTPTAICPERGSWETSAVVQQECSQGGRTQQDLVWTTFQWWTAEAGSRQAKGATAEAKRWTMVDCFPIYWFWIVENNHCLVGSNCLVQLFVCRSYCQLALFSWLPHEMGSHTWSVTNLKVQDKEETTSIDMWWLDESYDQFSPLLNSITRFDHRSDLCEVPALGWVFRRFSDPLWYDFLSIRFELFSPLSRLSDP